MKKTEWNAGLDNIAPELVEKYVKQRDMHRESRKRRSVRTRLFAAAVCAVLAAGSVCAFVMLRPDDPAVPAPDTCELTPPELPDWSGAKYSAQDIAGMFNSQGGMSGSQDEGVATSNYYKVYVSDPKYLHIDEIPEGEYIDVYELLSPEQELDYDEFREYVDHVVPRFSSALGAETVPEYDTYSDQLNLRVGNCELVISYGPGVKYCTILKKGSTSKKSPMVLAGNTVEIDRKMSDEEILRSLEGTRDVLFEMFDVEYEDATVWRRYDSTYKHGETTITVIYHNNTDGPGYYKDSSNTYSDMLMISFENVSTDWRQENLTAVYISCYDYKADPLYKESREKRISLEMAEELLEHGCVFGSAAYAVCSCMPSPQRITFDTYDYVDIEYMSGMDPESGKWISIPFYAFYKKIGEAENGNLIFAKTYVAAIELSGYEEYFESIAAKAHK